MLHLVKLEPARGPLSSSPLISVCVPARNEERGIRACLESLLRQDYPRFEVIAVDDNSTDATPAIVESLAAGDPRLTLARGEALPEGWFGKPYALHQAYRRAQGEYLLFTDADPAFRPFALTAAMYVMRRDNLDVLTLLPGTEFGSFWERAVQPVIFGFIAALTRFRKVNGRDHPDAMGIGAFMLFRRDAYERIGGHERVRQEIVEDIALAKCAKREGLNLLIADGKRVYSIRMYHSFREIWLGWRKNMFVAMKQSVARTLYYISAVLCFVAAPYLTFFANLALGAGSFWTAVS
ncbi:MAG: glycosyltransferase, partial [Nitrospinae bacterium]|nr:glycosyltransferase [Nitrospinota bacterium]